MADKLPIKTWLKWLSEPSIGFWWKCVELNTDWHTQWSGQFGEKFAQVEAKMWIAWQLLNSGGSFPSHENRMKLCWVDAVPTKLGPYGLIMFSIPNRLPFGVTESLEGSLPRKTNSAPMNSSKTVSPMALKCGIYIWYDRWHIYIYTWNLFVLYFEGWTIQNKAFSSQNEGHLGSRYIYSKLKIYIYSCLLGMARMVRGPSRLVGTTRLPFIWWTLGGERFLAIKLGWCIYIK